MWDHPGAQNEPEALSTDELVTCYGLAARLKSYEHGPSLDTALRLWLFTARKELEKRGQLERVRDWLPLYIDPTKRNPVFGPGAALRRPNEDPPAVRQVAG